MSFDFLPPARAEGRRDLVQVATSGKTAIYLHELLYRYFLEHPLRLRTTGLGPWRWLAIESEVDVGQAIATQTFT